MPLIVNGDREEQKVTSVQAPPLTTRVVADLIRNHDSPSDKMKWGL